ncbi:hypothetical protein MTO96_004558 [Rhipicephalus appendiculatus]
MNTDVSTLRSRGNFFVILDLKEQIKSLLAKTKDGLFENLIKIRTQSEQNATALRDTTSGQASQNLRRSGKISWMDLTATFNTDGSPVFKASSSSVWPIQLLINELTPESQKKNSLIGGLWFGKHPDMLQFMSKFVDELNAFGHIIWKHAETVMRSSLYAIFCCVDAPARASVCNMVQFNGLFGCPWCYSCAEFVAGM